MRKKCKDDSTEVECLDQAIAILAPRVSKRVRRRMNPLGVATFSIVGVFLFAVSYVVWDTAINSEMPWVWAIAVALTFGSLTFLAGGIPILSKVDSEDDSESHA